jgi:hypothetical protein
MKKLYGTGVALVTPFHWDKSVDLASLKKLLNHTAKGVDYFVVMGTTGESATLTKEEKMQVLEFVKKNNGKELPIVYGIGGNMLSKSYNPPTCVELMLFCLSVHTTTNLLKRASINILWRWQKRARSQSYYTTSPAARHPILVLKQHCAWQSIRIS